MKILLSSVFVLLVSFGAEAQSPFRILNPKVPQGGTAVIEIASQWQKQEPGINIPFFLEENYIPNKNGYIFLGIPVDTRPGIYAINFTEFRVERPNTFAYFEVTEAKFPEWFRGPAPVLNRAVQERLERDRYLKNQAYNLTDNYEDYTEGKFLDPLDVMEITGEFGTKRVYGIMSRKTRQIRVEKIVYHSGVDLRARTPLDVKAINSGRVILAKRLLADGNIVIIDHGSGILSFYLHLSRILVKEGDLVRGGQIFARTGATGAAQGPHLHFMVRVGNTFVDPLAFLDTMNQYLK